MKAVAGRQVGRQAGRQAFLQQSTSWSSQPARLSAPKRGCPTISRGRGGWALSPAVRANHDGGPDEEATRGVALLLGQLRASNNTAAKGPIHVNRGWAEDHTATVSTSRTAALKKGQPIAPPPLFRSSPFFFSLHSQPDNTLVPSVPQLQQTLKEKARSSDRVLARSSSPPSSLQPVRRLLSRKRSQRILFSSSFRAIRKGVEKGPLSRPHRPPSWILKPECPSPSASSPPPTRRAPPPPPPPPPRPTRSSRSTSLPGPDGRSVLFSHGIAPRPPRSEPQRYTEAEVRITREEDYRRRPGVRHDHHHHRDHHREEQPVSRFPPLFLSPPSFRAYLWKTRWGGVAVCLPNGQLRHPATAARWAILSRVARRGGGLVQLARVWPPIITSRATAANKLVLTTALTRTLTSRSTPPSARSARPLTSPNASTAPASSPRYREGTSVAGSTVDPPTPARTVFHEDIKVTEETIEVPQHNTTVAAGLEWDITTNTVCRAFPCLPCVILLENERTDTRNHNRTLPFVSSRSPQNG